MPLDNLPKIIQTHILSTMNKPQDQYYEVKSNEIHITETLYCIRKSFYKRKKPVPVELRAAYNMYRGNELDNRWTPLFPNNQLRCTHRIAGLPVTIVGKYDFFDPEDQCLGDLKTVKNLFYFKEGPKTEHVKQVRFYCYCNAIAKAKIIYVDYGDCVKHIVEITDELCHEVIKEVETLAIALYWSLVNDVPPEVDMTGKEWLCGFGKEYQCEYYNVCHGLTEEGALAKLAESELKRVTKKGKK